MLIKAGDIISQSIELYKKNLQLFIKYAVLLMAPSLLVTLLAMFLFPSNPANITLGWAMIAYGIIGIAVSIISIWFSIAFIKIIIERYEGKTVTSLKEEIMSAAKLIVPAILVSLLTGLVILGGTLLLIVPGIIFSIWYAFTFYAVIMDGKKTKESLGFSKSLVKGRWWGVLWRLSWPGLVFAIMMSIAGWIFAIPFRYLPQSTITVVFNTIVTSVITMLFAPLATIAPSILYVELKKNPLGSAEMPKVTGPAEPPQV